jgi:hypothetical protein
VGEQILRVKEEARARIPLESGAPIESRLRLRKREKAKLNLVLLAEVYDPAQCGSGCVVVVVFGVVFGLQLVCKEKQHI